MKEKKKLFRKKMLKMLLLILINIAIFTSMLLICLRYVQDYNNKRRSGIRDSFTTSSMAMRDIAENILNGHQIACDDWSSSIVNDGMELDKALKYLYVSSASHNVMAHVIDYDTHKGKSSIPDGRGNSDIDYTDIWDDIDSVADTVKKMPAEPISRSSKHKPPKLHSVLCMTPSYVNPVNSTPSIGFCHDIILNVDGSDKHFILIRVVPLSELTSTWTYPRPFDKAELSLISENGDYIIRSESMKDENFWEYVHTFNNSDYDDKQEIKHKYYSGQTDITELKNHDGKPSYYVCLPSEKSSSLYYVGYVPIDSVESVGINFTLVIVVGAGLVLLLLLDGGYILNINRTLRIKTAEAQEASVAKTRFLSSMSHDIRTPMNAIIGMTSLAGKHLDEPERINEYLGKITLASNHLLTLINDVLDISKIESGKLVLSPAIFSLAECTADIVNVVHPQVRQKKLKLTVRVSGMVHEHIYADELRLNQIFMNILSNAVKYTGEGGRIDVYLKEKPDPDNDKNVIIKYTVRDNGIGMSPEFVAKMYEPFSRMFDSRIDKIKGTGLGLAITRQMTDLMGGRIDCVSELGKGTEFSVTLSLPIAEGVSDERSLPDTAVLMADSDIEALPSECETLSMMDIDADAAKSGKAVMELIQKKAQKGSGYRAVMIDFDVLKESGRSISSFKDACGGNTLFIVSAYDPSDIEDDPLTEGADSFITKPLFRSNLFSKLNGLLKPDKADKDTPAEKEDSELAGMNILVAEDTDLNWEIISEMLAMKGITSSRAENGLVCLQMLTAEKPGTFDAILMDVQMPIMNGKEAAQKIRSLPNKERNSIPIIAMTADAFAEDIQACLEAGMNAHIPKPIDINKVFRELRSIKEKKAE